MAISLRSTDSFSRRHIGIREEDLREMLSIIGVNSLDELIDQTVPEGIRTALPDSLPKAMSEADYLQHIKGLAEKNKVFRSYIGMGYHGTRTPTVILRNIFQNPGWYTQYTPYQAEIAQGRLEALLNFQTMVSDLTGLPIANASLLDEGTAAAEAMNMFFHAKNKRAKEDKVARFFVSDTVLPQTISVLETRAWPHGIELVIGDHRTTQIDETYFGALLQYPAQDGSIHDYQDFIEATHNAGAYVVMAADILSLAVLKAPGEMGADAAVGNTQRFGIPMGFGGPHAAYFATSEDFKRQEPGRIIGVSIDRFGEPAYRMALQTREQHIRREKATSNICTAQALLAIMAGMYAVYHGPSGIRKIAQRVNLLTNELVNGLKAMGVELSNDSYFDNITLKADDTIKSKVKELAVAKGMNFRYWENGISINLDESTNPEDVAGILDVIASANGKANSYTVAQSAEEGVQGIPASLVRESDYLTHAVFNKYHSETQMMRYIKSLENKDLSLTGSMIPLGSCTMKLNAATELFPVSWPEFADIHPFAPEDQTKGYLEMICDLAGHLNKITGFAATSFQPNSGAQGEFAGLMVIRAYQKDKGEGHRNVALIPSSAHGTNPASAVMAGMEVVVVKCDEMGNIDVEDLKAKAEKYKDTLSALMVTYPSTHGVFEEGIKEVCKIIHENGGQVYMDGANMNAQVGLTNPATIGADVCHLNLHKTFAIPHGGGGPGMGPICVVEHLAPYLPGHDVRESSGEKGIASVSAAPWGSASILLISYAYILMLGKKGMLDATKYAILNANYLKSALEKDYDVLYVGSKGRIAHEMILDFRDMKHQFGLEVEDVAKRLMDYSFHAPTVSFPVAGTLMVEPTESEDKEELDRFITAMRSIREEISKLENGTYHAEDNVLKNAPHPQAEVISDSWTHSYSREEAAYPVSGLRTRKFWAPVGRVNNLYGDKNLVCTCPPMEAYEVSE